MAYVRKTRDVWVLEGNYGESAGWELLTAEETRSEIRARLRDYRENDRASAAYRIRKTWEKIKA